MPLNFSNSRKCWGPLLNWKYHNEGFFTAKAYRTFSLPPPCEELYIQKTILPPHPFEIRDLNEGVSSRKMDRSRLMCFFFLSHSVWINSSSSLELTWDIRVMNLKGKHWACLSYFQCLGCHKPKFLDSTHDLLKGSKLQANFTNMLSISYLLKKCVHWRGRGL